MNRLAIISVFSLLFIGNIFAQPSSTYVLKNELYYRMTDYARYTPGTIMNVTTGMRTLMAAIGTTKSVIHFQKGTYSIADTMTIPNNIVLWIEPGAMITVSSNKTVTIKGGIRADKTQIFDCSPNYTTGNIIFGMGNTVTEIYPEWWGAKANATIPYRAGSDSTIVDSVGVGYFANFTDNSFAFNKMFEATTQTKGGLGFGHFVMSAGVYYTASPIYMNTGGIFEGQGDRTTLFAHNETFVGYRNSGVHIGYIHPADRGTEVASDDSYMDAVLVNYSIESANEGNHLDMRGSLIQNFCIQVNGNTEGSFTLGYTGWGPGGFITRNANVTVQNLTVRGALRESIQFYSMKGTMLGADNKAGSVKFLNNRIYYGIHDALNFNGDFGGDEISGNYVYHCVYGVEIGYTDQNWESSNINSVLLYNKAVYSGQGTIRNNNIIGVQRGITYNSMPTPADYRFGQSLGTTLIDGNTIQGDTTRWISYGIMATGGTGRNAIITNNTIARFSGIGIWLWSGNVYGVSNFMYSGIATYGDVSITNNFIRDGKTTQGTMAIQIGETDDTVTSKVTYERLNISDNTITVSDHAKYSLGYGILAYSLHSHVIATDVMIKDNFIWGSHTYGIYISSNLSNYQISGNNIQASTGGGIHLINLYPYLCLRNGVIVSENIVKAGTGATTGGGIFLDNGRWASIINNTIYGYATNCLLIPNSQDTRVDGNYYDNLYSTYISDATAIGTYTTLANGGQYLTKIHYANAVPSKGRWKLGDRVYFVPNAYSGQPTAWYIGSEGWICVSPQPTSGTSLTLSGWGNADATNKADSCKFGSNAVNSDTLILKTKNILNEWQVGDALTIGTSPYYSYIVMEIVEQGKRYRVHKAGTANTMYYMKPPVPLWQPLNSTDIEYTSGVRTDAILAGAQLTFTIACVGATTSNYADVTPNKSIGGASVYAYCSTTDVVTVVVNNNTASTITLGSVTFKVRVKK